jgi:hypothetical protein
VTRYLFARSHLCSSSLSKDNMVLPTTEMEDRVSRLEDRAELEDRVSRLEDLVNQLHRSNLDMRGDINDLIVESNGIEMMVTRLQHWTPWLVKVWRWWFHEPNAIPHWIPSSP